MNYEYAVDYDDFRIIFFVNGFVPARPAPACSNPDSPAFSDCGDDEEVDEILAYFNIDGKTLRLPEAFEIYMIYRLHDSIIQAGYDKIQEGEY